MPNINWRNMRWQDMKSTEKGWFILMCLLLFILVIAIILDSTGVADIPDWVALIWVVCAGYTSYKNITANNLFSDVELNDGVNSEIEDE